MRFSKLRIYLFFILSLYTIACGNDDDSETDTGTDPDEYNSECTAFVDGEVEESGEGWSWNTAVKTVQEGIDLAYYGATEVGICDQWEVWVKQGTYYIYQDSRENTVLLKEHTALLGGFDGTETAEFDRQWDTNVTTLDGRDGPDGENHVYHVVIGSDNATLDGFTITGGRADDDVQGSMHSYGGGMSNYYASPTVTHCVFDGNYGIWSGGMDIWQGSPVVSACTFSNNSSRDGGGAAGVYEGSAEFRDVEFVNNSSEWDEGWSGGLDIRDSDAIVERCKFIDNYASWGGGLVVMQGVALLNECEFIDNVAGLAGGGVLAAQSMIEVRDSLFRENSAAFWDGGGLFSQSSELSMTNTVFENNTAVGWGGGLIVRNSNVTTTVSGSIFDSNTAGLAGGGVYNRFGDATYTNCVFTGNSTNKGTGGAMHSEGATTQATNCSFYDNTALNGATLYSATALPDDGGDEDSSTIINSIAWNDSALEIEWDGATPVVTYSDIEGGFKGDGNIDLDPLFVDPANGDLSLQSKSPCVGAALPEAAPKTDFDGNPRDEEPDMGAYEVQ